MRTQEWLRGACKQMLSRRGFAVNRRPPPLGAKPEACLTLSFDHILSHYLLRLDRVPYFVQVGSNDGVSGDPLYPYTRRGLLRGCLIEPQADVFERLCANYAGVAGVTFKRAAIGPESGEATLYRVRPGTPFPTSHFQLSSFRREVMLRHAATFDFPEEVITTETVPTITFDDLFGELGVEPDILVIDTEGYDYEVIKLLDVPRRRPRLILYESRLLKKADRDECIELLLGLGYHLATFMFDTVAYRSEEFD